MTREELKSIFDALRNDPQHHLGLGDIRLTIAQQDAILDLFPFKDNPIPSAEGAEAILRKPKYNSLKNLTLICEAMEEFAAQQQPTAEGAEEILASLIESLGEPDNSIHDHSYEIRPLTVNGKCEWWMFHNGVGSGEPLAQWLQNFAALHAQRIAEKTVSERDELQVLMNDISEWSDKTFGEGQRNPAIVHHLKKEVDELIEAINKAHGLGGDQSVGVGEYGRQLKNTRTEYADCMMLLLDSALHFGISAKELLSLTREKLEVNKARKWGKPDENGVVEHVKEPTAEGAEEILKNRLGNQYSILSPLGIETIIAAMTEFAALHAQRIAEKMVEDKLRDELVMFGSYFNNLDPKDHILVKDIDEYLKSRK